MIRGRSCLQVVTHQLLYGRPVFRASQQIEYPGAKIIKQEGETHYLPSLNEHNYAYFLGKLRDKSEHQEIVTRGWSVLTNTYTRCS
jgi:hypothetical protein